MSRPRLLLAVNMYPDGGGISAIVENCVQALNGPYEVHVGIVEARAHVSKALPLGSDRVHILARRNLLKPMVMPTSLLFTAWVGRFFRSLVRSTRPAGLLVQDGLFLPLPGAIATWRTNTRLAVMDHGTLSNWLDPTWQRMVLDREHGARRALLRLGFMLDTPWREARWRLGLTAADAAWYVGAELRPLFARAGCRASPYAQLVPRDFRPPDAGEREAARRQFAVSPDDTVINVVTRLDGEKGLDTILEALSSLDMGHNARVLVAGDGTMQKWFSDELERRRLGPTVSFLGRLDRRSLLALHHASDFHLYAGTVGCGVSIALLEAMACGVIPIVSDVPRAQRDLVGRAGWVFPAGDGNALKRCLQLALETGSRERAELELTVHEQLEAYAQPSLRSLVDALVGQQ